ncbi:FAD-dependent monooxygenase [Solihabitans fulvus]|uniref:FAD-dependent monooxygenase n=1 Tax=Solihabitans fulvus TaxID=1892852 RepID=UPI001CB76567|nr:FAD-dependent monooxygenase [Solihabitans fulvus]
MDVQNKPVVVVGAGPCGLVAACELLRLGVPVRVLDAEPEPAKGSRAIILWPPTLEVLAELGVLTDAEARGVRAKALAYHMGDGKVLRIELGSDNEPLLLPQEETGRLLVAALEKLGGRVEQSTRVVEVHERGDSVVVHAMGPDGVESIEAAWLIGADGIGSTVRQQSGVEFAGDAVPTTFLLAEGELSGAFDRNEVHYFLRANGVMLLSPLPEGRVRVSGPIAPDLPVTEETAQRVLDERGPGGLRFTTFTTLGTFTSQERIAATLRQGRMFLVGDAAHVHSAVGGQGLNLGVQDGRNLAWKLAGVIDGRFAPAVLDSYSVERRAAAEQVVKATSRMAKQAVVGPIGSRVRNAVWALLDATGALRSWYAPMLAGRLTRYPDVLFGTRSPRDQRRGRSRALPQRGSRTPTWVPDPAEPTAGLRLLTLGVSGGDLDRAGRALADRFPGVLAHEHFTGRGGAGFLLLRPDGFVADSGASIEALTGIDRALSVIAETSNSPR